MNRNFLVTGMGRSGTKFLSWIANQSSTWTVLHEPEASQDARLNQQMEVGAVRARPSPSILKRFERDFYGEVNSLLRQVVWHIPLRRAAIILRDPRDLVLSAANRRPTVEQAKIVAINLYHYYREIHLFSMHNNNIAFVDFSRMVSDVQYLSSLLNYLGVDDVAVTQDVISARQNETKSPRFESFDALHEDLKQIANNIEFDRSLFDRSDFSTLRP